MIRGKKLSGKNPATSKENPPSLQKLGKMKALKLWILRLATSCNCSKVRVTEKCSGCLTGGSYRLN